MTDRTTAIGVEIDANPRMSAVSWGAVLAGALVATAVTLALFVLGTGLGLTMVSPWSEASADATTIAISTIVWLVVVQWASAGIGGYMTGRLRTRWAGVQSDEVFFRDTAHGFLMWALATIFVAGLASHGLTSLLGAGAQVAGQVAGGAAAEATESVADPTGYFVDSLFRPAGADGAPAEAAVAPTPPPATLGTPSAIPGAGSGMPSASPPAATAGSAPSAIPTEAASAADRGATREETTRIVLRGMTGDAFPTEDRTYLVQLVADETGMSAEEAEIRVDDVLQGLADAKAEAQAMAEEAREAAVTLSVIAFVSLLVGALIGSVAAALGGSHRDERDVAIVLS